MLAGRTFDHALRHEPIFPCKLVSVRLSTSRSETGVGNWMNQGQEKVTRSMPVLRAGRQGSSSSKVSICAGESVWLERSKT